MPRTSSIDSAISSTSTSSHPQKLTLDLSQEEIRSLIDAAGSPEILIQQLLKEKNTAVSQNAQLWKLVDKQRAMVLGLNKDLERLNKEKDHYRKKLKEMQGQIPQALPQMIRRDSQSPVRNGTPSTTATEEKQSAATSTRPQGQLESSLLDPAMIPSPMMHLQQQQAAKPELQQDAYSSLNEASVSKVSRVTQSIPLLITDPEPSNGPSEPAQNPLLTTLVAPGSEIVRPTELLPVQTSLGLPSLNLIEPSPLVEKTNKSFSGARKAPAPLNLKQSNAPIMKAGEPAGSTIIEGVEADVSPPGRGRRKTREEDDREREIAALQEKEARSLSKKEKRSKARPEGDALEIKETHLIPPSMPSIGLPASPRHPPPAIFDRLAPSNVTLSNVQAGSQGSGGIAERLLTAPLKSPGLPMSPRPGSRPMGSPLPRNPKDNFGLFGVLPASPRSGMPLSPRAPTKPIPLPPGSQLAAAPLIQTSADHSSQLESTIAQAGTRTMSPTEAPPIYRGLVSSAFPDLLLPPNALPSVDVKVASSRLRPSNSNNNTGLKPQEDSAVFSLSIFSRSNGQELWRIEKSTVALPQLDYTLRPLCNTLPRLPERKLFNGHAPAIMDARRNSINAYFDELLDTPMDENAASIVCRFISTDTIDSENNVGSTSNHQLPITTGRNSKPKKSGYLTKRGKNFGGWKSRYYVLEGPELRCYENPGGPHLSTIKLLNAQIGKQSQGDSPPQSDETDENQYRHAFLVLEPKKKDSNSLMKHVLCAESDTERDEWVEALLRYVDGQPGTSSGTTIVEEARRGHENDDGSLKALNYADTVPGALPTINATAPQKMAGNPNSPQSISASNSMSSNHDQVTAKSVISGPTNGAIISDAGLWGNKPATQVKEHKKRNIFHFKQRPSTDSAASQTAVSEGHNTRPMDKFNGPAVFGLPLADAVEFCSPIGVDVNLPAVVYRCIEYLRAKNAASEEGIFRLSGSNLVIRNLKERFNAEGDVDFLASGEYYDVHAIASLFKSYLRELPSTVLTRELHLDFLHVLDLSDNHSKITAFNTLVHRLPPVNYSLLRTLSQFLLEVVQNSDQNRMSVRNVGIVFAPTLNIPAPVFAMFLTEFDAIFGEMPTQEGQAVKVELTVPNSLSPVDIRSPRRQMFSDLPTPAYTQTAFGNGSSATEFPSTPNEKPSIVVNSTDDVGFTPLQQSYDTGRNRTASQPVTSHQPWQPFPQQSTADAVYGSLNRMMAPENALTVKAKRRESSMLFL
jgi:RalA-binding protein 1